MFCNKCGNQLDDNAVFCAKCGNRVDGGAPAPAPKPVRPAKVSKPISAATLGYLRISSFALFVFGLILWFGGAPISFGYLDVAAAMPGLLVQCDATFCTVLAVIFYSLGIIASVLPFLGGIIGNSLPENVKALICKKTYIQLLCAFIAFVFYIVGFSIILSKGGCGITFYCIFSLLLQIAHMVMLYYINTKTN